MTIKLQHSKIIMSKKKKENIINDSEPKIINHSVNTLLDIRLTLNCDNKTFN